MTEDELVTTYPRLWHMAEDGSWPSIKEHGLLSTTALLDLYQLTGNERHALEADRRPESVTIRRKGLPDAVVRDQIPMTSRALRKCLQDDLTPEEWYRILNDKAFFWLSRNRLRGLLGAKAYRDRPQTVLTLDTKSLVAAHRKRILLSPINSGSTIMKPQPRGHSTFLDIAQYPFAGWRKKRRGTRNAVVELVVSGGVPDVRDHVLAAHRVLQKKAVEIWRAPAASPDDGP